MQCNKHQMAKPRNCTFGKTRGTMAATREKCWDRATFTTEPSRLLLKTVCERLEEMSCWSFWRVFLSDVGF